MRLNLETLQDLVRTANGLALVPVLKVTGFRFSKDYRYGTTTFHKVVYALVDTIGANLKAGIEL